MGLLVACQTTVVPPPVPTSEPPSGTPLPTLPPLPPQATSPVAGSVAGTWGRVADLPTPRQGAATVVFENRIVVIGGIGGLVTVERYDPATKMWDRMPDLPVGIDHAMAAAIEEGPAAGIFLFGGFARGQPSKRSFYLARDESVWREINNMPEIRVAGAAVTVGKKIYVVGGAAVQGKSTGLPTFVFDLEGVPWSTKADIPTPRDSLSAVRIGDKVCTFGGRQILPTHNYSAVECYDPATDRWEQLPPLPLPRGASGAAVVGDRVVLLGGEDANGSIGTVDVYDATTRTWSRGPDLPSPRFALGVAAVGTTIYAIGGAGPSRGNTLTGVAEALTLR